MAVAVVLVKTVDVLPACSSGNVPMVQGQLICSAGSAELVTEKAERTAVRL